jgi:hypothetical protein
MKCKGKRLMPQMLSLVLLMSVVFAASAITFSPVSGAADCNSGTTTWTGTGFPANMNGTLYVGGSALTVASCTVGSDTGAGFNASAAGAFTCVTAVSTSQANGVTTLSVVDGDGGAGNKSYDYKYGYCAKYGSADAGEATIDTITGLFDGLASLMKVLGIAIIAGILIGVVAMMILKIKVLG